MQRVCKWESKQIILDIWLILELGYSADYNSLFVDTVSMSNILFVDRVSIYNILFINTVSMYNIVFVDPVSSNKTKINNYVPNAFTIIWIINT